MGGKSEEASVVVGGGVTLASVRLEGISWRLSPVIESDAPGNSEEALVAKMSTGGWIDDSTELRGLNAALEDGAWRMVRSTIDNKCHESHGVANAHACCVD